MSPRIVDLPLLLIATGLLAACGSVEQRAAVSGDGLPQATNGPTSAANLGQTAFRATLVATVRQPVTSVKTGMALSWHRWRELVAGNLPVSLSPREMPVERPGTESFEAWLDDEGLPSREAGRVSCLVDGAGFFGEFDRQLGLARSSVEVQVYIFDNDDIGVRYARKLAAKSNEVAVRVLFDDMGTNTALMSPPLTPAPEGFVAPGDMRACLMEDSRVEVRRTLNPWLVVDHTKLLVFDRRTAILGGMNIGREYYSEWHDLMIKVEGPIVGSLAREFESAWRKAGPFGDFSALVPRQPVAGPGPVEGEVPLRILRTDAAAGRIEVLRAGIAAIRASRERVWIENPYFASDDVVREVLAAARRGVDVRVVLPETNDSALMEASNLATARELISVGAKVYHYPRMTHLKAMICDGWATVGSANLDTLSMRINRELNLAFSDRGSVEHLAAEVFVPDFRRSKRLTMSETESLIGPLVESIADQF